MNNTTQQIVNKAGNFAHVLLDDGLSYMAYTQLEWHKRGESGSAFRKAVERDAVQVL